jgi:hypothetical protein
MIYTASFGAVLAAERVSRASVPDGFTFAARECAPDTRSTSVAIRAVRGSAPEVRIEHDLGIIRINGNANSGLLCLAGLTSGAAREGFRSVAWSAASMRAIGDIGIY